ncbi:hypothetical protein ENBRE01_0253 [Enteropsectra breve]|nr:hypothetical protein ENBRE01_0253 [Enteropsectra breve]
MKIIGFHLSIQKGMWTIQEQMDMLKCDTCALFLKSQKRHENPPLLEETIAKFHQMVRNKELLVPHGPYIINLANPETEARTYANFIDDIKRCHALGIKYYNIHPGSDVKEIGKEAIKLVASQINNAHREVSDVVILLENMAGQGRTLGRNFEELRDIISHIEDKERVGVTLDTAHLHGAGYDIRTAEKFESVMCSFNEIVGLKYLKAVHLNDSKVAFGSNNDRHETLGKGQIGTDAFKYVMQSPYFDNIPIVLETPDPLLYPAELEMLRNFEREAKSTEN